MENQNEELDPKQQKKQPEQDRQGQDNNHAGDYSNDAGVIPDEELRGSDADRDSGSDNKPADKDMDIDENAGGTAI